MKRKRLNEKEGAFRGLPLLILASLALIPVLLSANLQAAPAPSGDELIARMEDIMRGKKSLHSRFTMTVKRPRWDRSMKAESWDDRGRDASFIRILAPPRDEGTAFLKADGAFRNYIPRVRRTVRISKSMMLQSWMGSDFSNDDLARESSYTDDYTTGEGKSAVCDAGDCFEYELQARPGAPVVWPSLKVLLRRDGLPVEITFFNSRNEALKKMTFSQVKKIQGIPFPVHWEMQNLREEGNSTILEFSLVEFDRPISPRVFTTQNLTRGQ